MLYWTNTKVILVYMHPYSVQRKCSVCVYLLCTEFRFVVWQKRIVLNGPRNTSRLCLSKVSSRLNHKEQAGHSRYNKNSDVFCCGLGSSNENSSGVVAAD